MTGFREQGHGTPLVLLHRHRSSGAASWHKQMALSGYRVLAWDMPGYGESPMLPVAQANAGDYADALARMLDHAGVEQAVVVGHSLGALVAKRLCGEISPPRALPGVSRCRTGVRPGGRRNSGKKSGAVASSKWRQEQSGWRKPGRRSCCIPVRRRPISPPLPPECASCVVRAIWPRRGCWRTTIFTAGLAIITAGLRCGAVSRTLSLNQSWCVVWRATLRHAVHRDSARGSRQLSR